MRNDKSKYFFALFCLFIGAAIYGQDFGFGFGDDDIGYSSGLSSSLVVSIGGEVSASMTGYIEDFSDGLDHVRLGDIFSGGLNFSAGTSIVEGAINLNLIPSSSPIGIDEAYIRAYFGNFDVTAGLRKLTWGKADSFGPLDVINPLDTTQIYTEMADNVSLMGVKIARPLLHASYRFGQFSKIEGVFVPNFEGHLIASTGRWAPAQMDMFELASAMGVVVSEPDTSTLDYAQAGLRFTTTAGSADVGAQYYYGRLPQPSMGLTFSPPNPMPLVGLLYNPYHQIGLDYAQVLFGFNVRAELAANLTGDFDGDDGSVYNPSIAWSFGFDRDLFGVNLNLQVNESILLFHDKLGSDNFMSGNFDIEGGQSLTATRLTAALSKKFLRDELELRAAAVCGLEDKDFAVMPALIWSKDDLRFALSCGFFGGDSEGQLGQYKDNNFLKIALGYTF